MTRPGRSWLVFTAFVAASSLAARAATPAAAGNTSGALVSVRPAQSASAAPAEADAQNSAASPLRDANEPSREPSSEPAGTLTVQPSKDLDGLGEQTPGRREFDQTGDASILDAHNWAVMAYKSRHQLIVYYKSRLFRVYHAVFGRSPQGGTKLWEGDKRTPEGLYVIVKKYDSQRWRRFLRLNYPNRVDRYRYEALRDEGVVPAAHGRPVPEGGAIGIHGTDQPILNRSDINWTTGCISVDDDAILELDRLLPIGTIVVIKP